jgi:hypothetical protein
MLLTWFQPGPGSGYLFVNVNVCISVVTVLVLMLIGELLDFSRTDEELAWFGLLACAYVVLHLGFARLIVQVIRRFKTFTMFPVFLLHVILLVAAIILPLIAQLFILWEDDDTPLQVRNPLWTLVEAADGDVLSYGVPWIPFLPVVPVVVFGVAFVVFVANVVTASLELRQQRTSVPDRVVEDKAALHPVAEPEFTPSSPWDEKS